MSVSALPQGWRQVSLDEAQKVLAERERELSPNHALAGVDLEVVARREANDDVLFRRLDQPGRVSVVHLTWRGSIEDDARWPIIVFEGLFADFIELELTAESPS